MDKVETDGQIESNAKMSFNNLFLLILGLYLDFETLNSTFCNSGGVNCLTSPNLCVLQPTSIPSYSVSSGGLSS